MFLLQHYTSVFSGLFFLNQDFFVNKFHFYVIFDAVVVLKSAGNIQDCQLKGKLLLGHLKGATTFNKMTLRRMEMNRVVYELWQQTGQKMGPHLQKNTS